MIHIHVGLHPCSVPRAGPPTPTRKVGNAYTPTQTMLVLTRVGVSILTMSSVRGGALRRSFPRVVGHLGAFAPFILSRRASHATREPRVCIYSALARWGRAWIADLGSCLFCLARVLFQRCCPIGSCQPRGVGLAPRVVHAICANASRISASREPRALWSPLLVTHWLAQRCSRWLCDVCRFIGSPEPRALWQPPV